MRYSLILVCLVLFGNTSFSQSDSLKTKNKHLYITWGYTKAWYSKSTIHFKNHSGTGRANNYDFTVHNVSASDRPDFDKTRDIINSESVTS